jgi:hypothetical protein
MPALKAALLLACFYVIAEATPLVLWLTFGG